MIAAQNPWAVFYEVIGGFEDIGIHAPFAKASDPDPDPAATHPGIGLTSREASDLTVLLALSKQLCYEVQEKIWGSATFLQWHRRCSAVWRCASHS